MADSRPDPNPDWCDGEVVRRYLWALATGGRKPRPLTERERIAVAHYLRDAGESTAGIATALNAGAPTVEKLLAKPNPLRRLSPW